MNRHLLPFILIFVFTGLRSAAQENSSYHRNGYDPAKLQVPNNYSPLSTGQSLTGSNIDVIYHKIFWRINPDSSVKYIRGSVQTNFKTIIAGVTSINFDLNSVMTVDSVLFRGAKKTITWSGNTFSIPLGVTLPLGFIDSVIIFYRGAPPGVSGAAEGYQKGSTTAAGNYIMTLSESYEDRDWWPCKADMQDKIDSMDITISTPWGPVAVDTFWAACNGKMTDSTIIGNSRYFTFKNRYPTPSYLVCVCVARFARFYRTADVNGTPTPVVYNLLKRTGTGTQYNSILTSLDKINLVVSAFSSKFGDYPFKNEKHGFYEGLLGAGGMEHQTFSGIASGSIQSLTTLSHELMHQWFGDNVTFSTWNDLWLAEGFASYSESLAGELVPSLGINPYATRNGFKNSALALTTASAWIPNSSMTNSDLIWTSSYGSTVYQRGSMVVSMLRSICGDTKFFKALTNYQTSMHGRSATTDSLKNYFNAVLGQDISVFFTDYVGGSGSGATAVGGVGNPINNVRWNSPAANELVLQMGTQTRSGGSNVTYFRGPVVVHVKGASAGQDTTICFFDWGAGTLSYAGNGLSIPVTGNALSYYLSFTPTSVLYDDSARTLSTGSVTPVAALDSYTWFGTTNTTWGTASNWSSAGVPPSGADIVIATSGANQPVLPGNISIGPLMIRGANTVNLNNNTLTLNNVVRGTGTFTGSSTSNMVIADSSGVLNFTQTNLGTHSLGSFSMNQGSNAIIGTGALDIFSPLNLVRSTLTVRSPAFKLH
ncbi:MAG: M1 family aminopeptidase [Ferruginibacter sp.]